MSTAMLHIRIDETLKAQATDTLAAMGLSVSDAVRLLLTRIVAEQALPFAVKVPNAETLAAMRELEAGQGVRFESVEALMSDLHAPD